MKILVGPFGVAKSGVVAIAAHTGRPIVPVAIDASPSLKLVYLWSRMIVPLPFARVRAVLAGPLRPQTADRETRSGLAAQVTAAIAQCAESAGSWR